MADFVNPDNTGHRPNGTYTEVIDRIKKDGTCPFCSENLSKYHKNPVFKEGVYWRYTKSAFPYEGAKYHILIIHRDHIERFEEIVPAAWEELRSFVKFFMKEEHIPGATFMMRHGDTSYTGSSVAHLHAMLISPVNGDKDRKPIVTRVG